MNYKLIVIELQVNYEWTMNESQSHEWKSM